MEEMNHKQWKAFLILLQKELTRIGNIKNHEEIREELRETVATIQMVIED